MPAPRVRGGALGLVGAFAQMSGVSGFQRGGKSDVLNHPVLVSCTEGPCQQAFDHLTGSTGWVDFWSVLY